MRGRFTPESFTLLPDSNYPTELRIACANWECDFSGDAPLPIVAVDEPLYRRLLAFLVATVAKFASLPWVGEAGALLGGADRHDESGFYGAAETRRGNRLSQPLPTPDLIIQDELHLISGPLGRGHRRARPQPEGSDAAGAADAHGRGGTGVA